MKTFLGASCLRVWVIEQGTESCYCKCKYVTHQVHPHCRETHARSSILAKFSGSTNSQDLKFWMGLRDHPKRMLWRLVRTQILSHLDLPLNALPALDEEQDTAIENMAAWQAPTPLDAPDPPSYEMPFPDNEDDVAASTRVSPKSTSSKTNLQRTKTNDSQKLLPAQSLHNATSVPKAETKTSFLTPSVGDAVWGKFHKVRVPALICFSCLMPLSFLAV